MKKFLLILMLGVFTFGSSGFKAEAEEVATNCFTLADTSATLIGGAMGMNHFQENLLFHALYDACLDQNEDGF